MECDFDVGVGKSKLGMGDVCTREDEYRGESAREECYRTIATVLDI